MRAPAEPPEGRMPRTASGRPAWLEIEIAPMRRRHVRAVLAIEQRVYPRPWSSSLFMSEISQRRTRIYLVAQAEREVVGYGGMAVQTDEGHITTLAVAPEHQHRGIGARVLYEMASAARARGLRSLTLEVRVANWPAQRLYAWFGFRPVGIRRNYYAETGEDALIMWVDDIQGEDATARLARIHRATWSRRR